MAKLRCVVHGCAKPIFDQGRCAKHFEAAGKPGAAKHGHATPPALEALYEQRLRAVISARKEA